MLVSQRLLKSYQQKRQNIRNEKKPGDVQSDHNFALKAEHMGYRRFTPYGLTLEKEILAMNKSRILDGTLTDDTRDIDGSTLVCTIAVFPPRQKGIIARQSSEIRVLHTTKLTKLFAMQESKYKFTILFLKIFRLG